MAAQSLLYPINAKRQAKNWQVSIIYSIGLTRPGTELQISHTQNPRSTNWATVLDPSIPRSPIVGVNKVIGIAHIVSCYRIANEEWGERRSVG